jgi:autotransporter-associated beta strand protein
LGTLFVNGGTAICTNNIVKTTSIATTGTVAVVTGTLFVQGKIGTPAIPVDNLNVTNATLRLKVDASGAITTNICVFTVNAGGTTTFDIAQVIGVTGPTTFPLVGYSTLNATVAGNFALTYPSGYIASLVDNSAQKRIDLSITPSVILVPLVWTGATNGNWDTTTSNWTSAGVLATYTDASVTAFDDSASNSIVNLTAAFAPVSMTMSNSVLNYIFTNTGSIVNTNILTLKGSATTVLDNSGSNSFTGGVIISAGTLQVGNNDAKGNLPDGQSVIDNATLAFNRTDSHTNTSVISGTGTLAQNGSGTLTLAGANSYGATTISAGTLQVGAGGTSGSLGSGSVTDNGSLIFNRSDNLTFATVISGSGSVTKVDNNVLTLSGNNSYGGGLTVNAGTVRLANTNAAGAAATGTITINPGGTAVLVATNTSATNNILLAGGTLDAQYGAGANIPNQLTAAPSTTSTVLLGDPANLTPSQNDASEMNFTNTWHGSGNVIVTTVNNDATPDSGSGLRLRSIAASDFSGTLILSNTVKGELQTTVAGPFSPAGTGKIVLCAGVLTNNTVNGTFAELNLRNISAGNTTLGNNLEVTGSGFTTLDPLGTAPDGSSVTMGSLKVGAGQELGVNVNGTSGTGYHTVVFNSVTLNGGNATFSPKTSGWNTTPQVGSDLSLGNITELIPGSGFTMAGLRTLTLTGNTGNAYTGPTTNASGTLQLSKTAGNAIPGTLVITGGTVSYAGNDQIADSAMVSVSGGTLAMGAFNDTVGAVSLSSGSITGSGGTLAGASYDVQSGSASANLGGSATLTKSTGGTVSLTGTNTYTGSTLVNNGILQLSGSGSISNSTIVTVAANAALDASGRADGTFVLNSGQTLNGFGTVTGIVVEATGATLAPGSAAILGTLTVSSNATFNGATLMKINRNTATNDELVLGGTLTEGGTLTVTNLDGTLAANDTFKLFTAAVGISNTFTATNLPALGSGLGWDCSALPTTGTIKVVATVNTNATSLIVTVNANVLSLSWPVDHTGWRLQAQTNALDTGIYTNWVDVAGATATNLINVPLDSGNGSVFYRMVHP